MIRSIHICEESNKYEFNQYFIEALRHERALTSRNYRNGYIKRIQG